jgi:hydrogenase expression/formation protein HypE
MTTDMRGGRVTLAHGSGGRLTAELIRDLLLPHLSNPALAPLSDAALLNPLEGRLAMTTDGFVVSPLFFPGGDIGRLAVNGTVNDLAVSGAVPCYLSAACILEEGLPLADLEQVARSMGAAAREAGVAVVTGDTKVVEKGHGDGVFVVTAGVGRLRDHPPGGPEAVREGDAILVSGPVGDHGAVIAAHRMKLDLSGGLKSDCGPVHRLVAAVYDAGVRPRFMRDPTRGGLATVLAELGRASHLTACIKEGVLPVREGVRATCEILGLDPLYLACEGRVVVVVDPAEAEAALRALHAWPEGEGAAQVGQMGPAEPSPVVLETAYGGRRLYDTLASDPLPRIC